MARIIPKLDLNRTPQNCEDYSLVFAQNVKLGKDNVLTRDDGLSNILSSPNELPEGYSIVGVIPYNTCFFILLYNSTTTKSAIYKYTEYVNAEYSFERMHCGWNYSGGNIDGNVVQTLTGDIILSIAESFEEDDVNYKLIPLKFINFTKSTDDDNETIYSQLPEVPIINLSLFAKYCNPIPNGVYQFFIRYEIYKDCYTEWFPATKECFAGSPQIIDRTQLGTIKYLDTSYQSSESFVFEVNKIYTPTVNPYKKFQIGFILSTDDTVVARSWKVFDINVTTIHFDYDKEYIEELDINDIIRPAFDLYNVKNITMFKNKQYISNFVETDYNPDLVDISKRITVGVDSYNNSVSNTYELESQTTDFTIGNTDYKTYVKKDNDNEGYIGDYNLNIFTEFYKDYKNVKLKNYNQGSIYNSGTKFNDYGVRFKAYTSNNFIARADSLEELENHPVYGRYANAIINKFGTHENNITDVKYIIINNPLYNSGNVCIDDDDTGIYNAMLTEEFVFGKVDLNNSFVADEFYDGDPQPVEGLSNGKTLEYLGIGTYISNISSYNEVDKSYYLTAFKRIDDADSPYEPDPITVNDVTKHYESVMYSIVCVGKPSGGYEIVCRQINFGFFPTYEEEYEDINITDFTTLIPNQKYKFYIHYVKANGETTNGYVINNGDPIDISGYNNLNSILYPIFTPPTLSLADKNKLKDYVAYFISIQHYENNVVIPINGIYCLELDAKLYYAYKIYAKLENQSQSVTVPVKYRTSNDNSENYIYFGNTGLLDINYPSGFDYSNIKYIYIEYENNSDDVQLIKATPYYSIEDFISESIVDDYKDLNLLGYICNVYRIEAAKADDYDLYKFYASENVYNKSIDNNSLSLSVLEYPGNNDENKPYYSLKSSNSYTIYSNFNLNYLGLTEDGMAMIVPQLKQVQDGTTYYIPWYNFNSLQLSSFYKLHSMYHEYVRKTYSKYNEENYIKFDNTIRCSELVGDEEKLYRYTFDINDYYNIASNKGKIVNLAAIGTTLLVHTEDSIFKLSGVASFNSNQNEEVQTTETELFNAGANELFGSSYGFAGLQHKANALITEAGYFFYDEHANTIYSYSGQNNLKVLSDNITKLMNYSTIRKIDFASDLINDRIFINIDYVNNTYVTLSYNLATNNLISSHTFNYEKTFNTKVNCYFVNNNKIYKIDKNVVGYGDLVSDNTTLFRGTKISDNYPAIIDVVLVSNYEYVKTLDSVSWVCQEINNTSFNNARATIDTQDLKYRGNYIRIYSDSVDTENIDLQDSGQLNKFDSYKKPYYERGVWNLNYFRNVLNLLNIQDLPNKTTANGYVSDETTLIYGKYIVARFIFDINKSFKLENVSLNIK